MSTAKLMELSEGDKKITGDNFVVSYAHGTKAKTFKTKEEAEHFKGLVR